MKLKKIIKYIDSMTRVRIYQNTMDDTWEIVYEGLLFEMPYRLIECHLIEAKDNEDCEAICPFYDNGQSCLRITLGD